MGSLGGQLIDYLYTEIKKTTCKQDRKEKEKKRKEEGKGKEEKNKRM